MLTSCIAWISAHRILATLITLIVAFGIYGAYRPLPKEVDMEGTVYTVPDTSVTFLSDET